LGARTSMQLIPRRATASGFYPACSRAAVPNLALAMNPFGI